MSIDVSTLVWMIINFILLMILLNHFLFKPILSFMKQRQDKIAEGIQAGERAGQLLKEKQSELAVELSKAKSEANDRVSILSRQLELEHAKQKEDSDRYAEKRLTEIAGVLFAEEESLAAATESHINEYVAILQKKLASMNSAVPLVVADPAAREEILRRITCNAGEEGGKE